MKASSFCAGVSEIVSSECEALVTLYNNTGGANWSIKTGWLTTNTPCSWYGVYCIGPNISALELSDNNLVGSLPVEIGAFTKIINLFLDSNQLTGSIPTQIGSLTNLELLVLSSNQLSGNIPTTLGSATKLINLDLGDNNLTGVIPSQIGNLINLEELWLQNNRLSGNIPASFNKLTKATKINVEANTLEGEMPAGIKVLNTPTLEFFSIAYNSLYTSDAGLIAFFNAKNSGWQNVQTILPTNITFTQLSSTSARFNWTPISYTAHGGYYQISSKSGTTYAVVGNTANKSANTFTINNFNSTLKYVIRTFTPTNATNSNNVYSKYSAEFPATTPTYVAPTITITNPGSTNTNITNSFPISWTDDDSDSNATISLFRDNNNSGADGTQIVNNISEDADGLSDQHVWDTTSLPLGAYYVYAKITDGVNPEVVRYSTSTVTKVPDTTPSTLYFSSLDYALKNTQYISNTNVVSGLATDATVAVSGGTNSIIVKNGVDSGTSISIANNDLLAIKTTTPNTNTTTTVNVQVGSTITPWVLRTVSIPALPSVDGAQSGYTKGNFSVDPSGGASYSIPVTIAPGSGGIQPNLSLGYSNRGGNGIMGVGWNLGGLSMISRCPSIASLDTYNDAIDFDGNDKYCLDGERLIAISGTYGANNTEYRTEHESFSKIISYGTSGEGPTQFRVWTKAGLIMEFGFTADSRLEAEGKSNVLSWGVNKVSDTNGNYFTITYQEDNANSSFYPSRIDYTGNPATSLAPYASIQFTYQSRGDQEAKYVGGSLLKITQRLVNVKNLVGSSVIREYRLNYQNDTSSMRSQLASIQECGSDGSCFQPTNFEWSSITPSNFNFQGSGTGFWTGTDGGMANTFFGDYNGDGKTDTMKFMVGTANQWRVKTSNGTGFVDVGAWLGHGGGPQNNVMGDFNGDGKTDIAGNAQNGTWHVCLSTGSSFNCGFWNAYNGGILNGNQFPGDYNGDGRTDLMMLTTGTTNRWTVCLSTGSNFTCNQWTGHAGGLTNNILGDYNGDGMTDIMGYAAGGGQWHVCLSTGSGFNCSFWAGHSGGQANNFNGDYNGDGKTDIAGYGGTNQWHVCLSTGNSFTCSFWAGHAGTQGNNVLGDFNGDGRTDMAGYTQANGQWHVTLSTGSNFNAPGSAFWQGHAGGANVNLVGDFNGDGRSDMAGYTGSTNQWHVTLPGGVFPDLLKKITNGHGVITTVSYKPLTDPSVYTKYSDAVYPRYDFQSSFYVVSNFTQSNGIGGDNSFTYRYEGAQMNLLGRGFRGFYIVRVRDNVKGIHTISTYERDFRFNGMLLKSEMVLDNGTLIGETTNTLGVTNLHNTTYFAFVQQSVAKSNELNGSNIKTTTTNNQFDTFGNLTQSNVNYGGGFTETLTNTYSNNTTTWLLGRLTNSTLTKQAPNQTVQTRTSRFEYDSTTGLLSKEESEPLNATLRNTKTYVRDAYGNITQSTLNAPSVTNRVTKTVYDAQGRFVTRTINALNHVENKTNNNLGQNLTLTGPNGLRTTWQYDGFGRKTKEIQADGNQTQWAYRLCGSCPALGRYFVQVNSSGKPVTITYFDILDREIRQQGVAFSGAALLVDTQYNLTGQISSKSDPYTASPVWNEFTYDVLGRVLTEKAPGNRTNTYSYQGLTTEVTNPKGQKSSLTQNVLGSTVQTIDNLNSVMSFIYDSFNNLKESTDPAGNKILMEYDAVGNKTKVTDPDTGVSTFIYNALGELLSEKDAKNQTTSFTYDLLGRVLQKVEPEGTSTWTYDNKPKAIGKATKVTGPNGYQENYIFDTFGRVIEKIIKIDGKNYPVYTSFDQLGREDRIVNPSGFSTKNVYNTFNYLNLIRNATNNDLIWQANAINARGQIESQNLGNGLNIRKIYDTNTGYNTSIVTGTSTTDSSKQNLVYTYDEIGNVLTRRDNIQAITEVFAYDSLNRLTSSKAGSQAAVTLQYNAIGNITNKSNVGNYTYGTRPHAVTTTSGTLSTTFGYDANGNRISGSGTSITYSSFDKPLTITKGTSNIAYQYGTGYEKIKSILNNSGVITTTTYIGSLFERSVTGSISKDTNYVYVDSKLIATFTKENNGALVARYISSDNLGSPNIITDQAKTTTENLSFDPWGNRRATNWTPSTSVVSSLNRGYTSHEQLDKLGLVHMGGRAYDPLLGRFTSADPVVQEPNNSQTYNRYSYVMNNPLAYTDPSGYNFFSDIWNGIKDFVKDNWKTIAAISIGFITGGIGFTFFGPIGAAFGFGFGSSFSGALLSGAQFGDALKAGMIGGSIAALSMGTLDYAGSYISSMNLGAQGTFAANTVANGVVGGASSIAQGGKFEHGFLSSAASFSLQGIPGEVYKRTKSYTLELMAASAVGGTVFVIGGGKFSNGAVTSGFMSMGGIAWRMRQDQIALSRIDIRNTTGSSVGYRGDGFKLAGGRIDESIDLPWLQEPSPLGGVQGGGGSFFGISYKKGDVFDYLLEAYAGPHDHLNSGVWYNENGNLNNYTGLKWLGAEALNFVNVIPATAFVFSSVVGADRFTFSQVTVMKGGKF